MTNISLVKTFAAAQAHSVNRAMDDRVEFSRAEETRRKFDESIPKAQRYDSYIPPTSSHPSRRSGDPRPPPSDPRRQGSRRYDDQRARRRDTSEERRRGPSSATGVWPDRIDTTRGSGSHAGPESRTTSPRSGDLTPLTSILTGPNSNSPTRRLSNSEAQQGAGSSAAQPDHASTGAGPESNILPRPNMVPLLKRKDSNQNTGNDKPGSPEKVQVPVALMVTPHCSQETDPDVEPRIPNSNQLNYTQSAIRSPPVPMANSTPGWQSKTSESVGAVAILSQLVDAAEEKALATQRLRFERLRINKQIKFLEGWRESQDVPGSDGVNEELKNLKESLHGSEAEAEMRRQTEVQQEALRRLDIFWSSKDSVKTLEEIKIFKLELEGLRKTTDAQQSEIQKIPTLLEGAEKLKVELQEQKSGYDAQLRAIKQSAASQEKARQQMKGEIEDARRIAEESRKACDEMQLRLQKQKSDFDAQLQNVKLSTETQIREKEAQLQAKSDDIRKELDKVHPKIEEFEQESSDLSVHLDLVCSSLTSALDEFRMKMEAEKLELQAAYTRMANQVAALQNHNQAKHDELSGIIKMQNAFQTNVESRIRNLEGYGKELDDSIRTYHSELSSIRGDIDQISRSSTKNADKENTADWEALVSRVDNISRETTNVSKQVRSLVQTFDKRLDKLVRSVHALGSTLSPSSSSAPASAPSPASTSASPLVPGAASASTNPFASTAPLALHATPAPAPASAHLDALHLATSVASATTHAPRVMSQQSPRSERHSVQAITGSNSAPALTTAPGPDHVMNDADAATRFVVAPTRAPQNMPEQSPRSGWRISRATTQFEPEIETRLGRLENFVRSHEERMNSMTMVPVYRAMIHEMQRMYPFPDRYARELNDLKGFAATMFNKIEAIEGQPKECESRFVKIEAKLDMDVKEKLNSAVAEMSKTVSIKTEAMEAKIDAVAEEFKNTTSTELSNFEKIIKSNIKDYQEKLNCAVAEVPEIVNTKVEAMEAKLDALAEEFKNTTSMELSDFEEIIKSNTEDYQLRLASLEKTLTDRISAELPDVVEKLEIIRANQHYLKKVLEQEVEKLREKARISSEQIREQERSRNEKLREQERISFSEVRKKLIDDILDLERHKDNILKDPGKLFDRVKDLEHRKMGMLDGTKQVSNGVTNLEQKPHADIPATNSPSSVTNAAAPSTSSDLPIVNNPQNPSNSSEVSFVKKVQSSPGIEIKGSAGKKRVEAPVRPHKSSSNNNNAEPSRISTPPPSRTSGYLSSLVAEILADKPGIASASTSTPRRSPRDSHMSQKLQENLQQQQQQPRKWQQQQGSSNNPKKRKRILESDDESVAGPSGGWKGKGKGRSGGSVEVQDSGSGSDSDSDSAGENAGDSAGDCIHLAEPPAPVRRPLFMGNHSVQTIRSQEKAKLPKVKGKASGVGGGSGRQRSGGRS